MVLLAVFLLLTNFGSTAGEIEHDKIVDLCRTNTALDPATFREMIEIRLQQPHDPSLDSYSVDDLVEQAIEYGINKCAAILSADESAYDALSSASEADQGSAWAAFNTECVIYTPHMGDCITRQILASRALMSYQKPAAPAGAKSLSNVCDIMMPPGSLPSDWQECVAAGLKLAPSEAAIERCRSTVPWEGAKSGSDAAKIITGCLSKNGAHR